MRKQLQRMGMLCLMLMTVMIGSAQVTAKWDFRNNLPSGIQENTNYQGVVADVESDVAGIVMRVDATNGKLYCVGRNNAQMNPGTVLQVPVGTTDDVVTVEGYPGYSHFAVGTQENGDEATVEHKATAAEVKQGYVEVTATAGNNYIYLVQVVQNKPDINAKWDFKNNLPEGICDATNYQGTTADVESTVAGVVMHVDATSGKLYCVGRNNAQMNPGTILQIPVVSNEDVVTVEGYPGYCHFAVGGDENGDQAIVTHKANSAEAKQGYVEVTATAGNNYIYSISVLQKVSKAPVKLDNVTSNATFPFNLGTNGQTADFGDTADNYLTSKVLLAEGLFVKDASTVGGVKQTRIEPVDQNNSADATNTIQFVIQPKYGLTFTPTAVSFKTTRFGTDNGLLDIAWLNPDGTTVKLATEVKPNRNNATPAYTELSYEVTGAKVDEGPCGLQINLYHLQSGKQIGFADIVIEGILNGELVEVPMLGGFTANGVAYVADDVFEADGDQYVATIEVSKKAQMVSAENPLTDVTAASGDLGEITYNGDDTRCVVTIPVSLAGITTNYVATFVQKPDFTLTYVDTDGTTIGTQAVEKDAAIEEFAYDYSAAKADEGSKVRGWFVKKSGGQKYTTDDIVTSNLTLYAVQTEIEGPSTFKKYNFNLADVYFYPEDHEAFETIGSGYWHDSQHGWAFNNGDVINLLVGPKAVISVGNCLYSNGSAELVFKDAEGNEVGRITGKGETDGEIAAFAYEGAEGKLTMEIASGGAVYIHSIRIVNTTETNYESEGNWYFVKAGDASSFIDVLDAVNGINGSREAERSYIFLPDGTYDLGETVLTAISGHNISIIGQSMEGTIIKNAPDRSIEGIGTTATLINSGQNLYMQDLTLQNALDYYGAQGAGQAGGRAVCFQDKADRAIFKNVAMLSYQDTYYSQGTKQSYWETCDIHGTVDFICGGGDVRFQNSILSLEPRNRDGKGGRTILAPTTSTDFGYVFDNCTVVDLANGKGDWNFGRTWNNKPIAVYLNTTLDENAAATLAKSRWTQKGMNNTDPRTFGEYGTINVNGENITPASNVITSYGGNFETVLTEAQAAEFSYDKMFKNNANAWDPASLTVQVDAPEATFTDGKLSWKAVEGAIAYAVFKNDVFQKVVTDGNQTDIEAEAGDVLTVRSANSMGGFGKAASVSVPEDVVVTLDENKVNEIPAVGTEVSKVNTVRTIVAGNWNSICLPFEISANQLADQNNPFYGAQVMQLKDATYNEAANAQNIDFKPATQIEAGKPYIIKVDADVVNPVFENVTIGAVEAEAEVAGNCVMQGVINPYVFETADKGVFFLSTGNKFSYVGEPGTMKGMRAFFRISGLSEAALSNMVVSFGEADGIKYVGETAADGKFYDLLGRQLEKAPSTGVFIVNGRKYVK